MFKQWLLDKQITADDKQIEENCIPFPFALEPQMRKILQTSATMAMVRRECFVLLNNLHLKK